MDGKEENLCTDSYSFLGLHSHHVCIGKPSDKAVIFSWLRRRLTLIKKIVHFSISMLMLNSDRMVLLHLIALDFYRTIVIQTSFITRSKSQHHVEIFKCRKTC